ncbi:MAG: hypothetical protein GY801_11995 [bacterium]|nr:hypothetical protein [bacterium]
MYLLVQHRYSKVVEQQFHSYRETMQSLRRQLLDAPALPLLFEEMDIKQYKDISTILLNYFKNSSGLLQLSLLNTEGAVLWGKETKDQMKNFLRASSDYKKENGIARRTASSFDLNIHTIQLPLQLNSEQKGVLRGIFLRNASHEMYVKVSKFTLYSASVSTGAIILLGMFSVAAKVSHRFSTKQRQLEEYAFSLQQANDTLRKTRKELYTSEKLASLGYLAAGIAHEIGNPLGAVLGYVDLLQKGRLDRQKIADILRRIGGDVERIQGIIQELLNFSRPHVVHLQKLDVNALIKKIIDRYPSLNTQQIHLQFRLTEFPLFAKVDEHKLRNVLLNLIGNSGDAISEHGDITISTFRKIRESATMAGGSEVIAIQVADTGSGIPEELLPKIFDPFFTTKDPGKGMGLGLSWCHRIIESFHGEMEVHSRPGIGTEVSIFLPPVRGGTDAGNIRQDDEPVPPVKYAKKGSYGKQTDFSD